MNGYTVEFARSASRELERLPDRVVQRVLDEMPGLQEQPRSRRSSMLTGTQNTYRLRVGEYRIVYEVDDEAIVCSLPAFAIGRMLTNRPLAGLLTS